MRRVAGLPGGTPRRRTPGPPQYFPAMTTALIVTMTVLLLLGAAQAVHKARARRWYDAGASLCGTLGAWLVTVAGTARHPDPLFFWAGLAIVLLGFALEFAARHAARVRDAAGAPADGPAEGPAQGPADGPAQGPGTAKAPHRHEARR